MHEMMGTLLLTVLFQAVGSVYSALAPAFDISEFKAALALMPSELAPQLDEFNKLINPMIAYLDELADPTATESESFCQTDNKCESIIFKINILYQHLVPWSRKQGKVGESATQAILKLTEKAKVIRSCAAVETMRRISLMEGSLLHFFEWSKYHLNARDLPVRYAVINKFRVQRLALLYCIARKGNLSCADDFSIPVPDFNPLLNAYPQKPSILDNNQVFNDLSIRIGLSEDAYKDVDNQLNVLHAIFSDLRTIKTEQLLDKFLPENFASLTKVGVYPNDFSMRPSAENSYMEVAELLKWTTAETSSENDGIRLMEHILNEALTTVSFQRAGTFKATSKLCVESIVMINFCYYQMRFFSFQFDEQLGLFFQQVTAALIDAATKVRKHAAQSMAMHLAFRLKGIQHFLQCFTNPSNFVFKKVNAHITFIEASEVDNLDTLRCISRDGAPCSDGKPAMRIDGFEPLSDAFKNFTDVETLQAVANQFNHIEGGLQVLREYKEHEFEGKTYQSLIDDLIRLRDIVHEVVVLKPIAARLSTLNAGGCVPIGNKRAVNFQKMESENPASPYLESATQPPNLQQPNGTKTPRWVLHFCYLMSVLLVFGAGWMVGRWFS